MSNNFSTNVSLLDPFLWGHLSSDWQVLFKKQMVKILLKKHVGANQKCLFYVTENKKNYFKINAF